MIKQVMNEYELIERCLIFNDAIVTYPFDDKKYGKLHILRHKKNRKWFGVVFLKGGKLCINLKLKPFDSVILRDNYDFIKPAWHMNKAHWSMIEVNRAPVELLDNLIKESYNLTYK